VVKAVIDGPSAGLSVASPGRRFLPSVGALKMRPLAGANASAGSAIRAGGVRLILVRSVWSPSFVPRAQLEASA